MPEWYNLIFNLAFVALLMYGFVAVTGIIGDTGDVHAGDHDFGGHDAGGHDAGGHDAGGHDAGDHGVGIGTHPMQCGVGEDAVEFVRESQGGPIRQARVDTARFRRAHHGRIGVDAHDGAAQLG